MTISIEIRPVETAAEYRAIEQLQREVWGMEDIEIAPHDLMLTAHKNGGLALGAFTVEADGRERMVGFVFGFVGLLPDGRPKQCSHMAGVLPAYQGQDIGYRLKLAQRERALAQGLEVITWTFDPLESRNAYFNFRKLGVTCNTYLPNVYGAMRDALNAGLPSDRFQVDWRIRSPRVAARLAGQNAAPAPSALQAEGIPLVNPVRPGELPRPVDRRLPLEDNRLLFQVPARFQAIKATDMGLALAWREHSRELFESAFARGYTAVDLLFENEQSFYLLEREIPDEDRPNRSAPY